ncbi:ThuA domain-containing protein [Asanoa sp. NPDC049573]|uniref:ThuA domain-containing protein n=1 Tax=Asanoa sp. NPDC049573 TaxID=3155396 RepID=UPI003448B11C
MDTRTVIFTGHGDAHTDPWHDLPATSAALAGVLGGGTSVTAVGDLEAALDGAVLLVVNATSYRLEPVPDDDAFAAVVAAFLAGGGGLLAMHSATVAFPGQPAWRALVGAAWEHGRTFHPPHGPSKIKRTGHAHPVAGALGDFEVVDERYTDLDLVEGITPLFTHDEGGASHPLVWAREVGGGRVVYDALGHDTRSYAEPAHAALLRRAAAWLRTAD